MRREEPELRRSPCVYPNEIIAVWKHRAECDEQQVRDKYALTPSCLHFSATK